MGGPGKEVNRAGVRTSRLRCSTRRAATCRLLYCEVVGRRWVFVAGLSLLALGATSSSDAPEAEPEAPLGITAEERGVPETGGLKRYGGRVAGMEICL